MCMSFVAVGRRLTIVSYVAFKMAALWFWTMPPSPMGRGYPSRSLIYNFSFGIICYVCILHPDVKDYFSYVSDMKWQPGGHCNMKIPSYEHKNSHYKKNQMVSSLWCNHLYLQSCFYIRTGPTLQCYLLSLMTHSISLFTEFDLWKYVCPTQLGKVFAKRWYIFIKGYPLFTFGSFMQCILFRAVL